MTLSSVRVDRSSPVHRPGWKPFLLTPDQMACADQRAIQGGVPGTQLMETAGLAVARAIVQRHPVCRVVVLCGPGNNGGDGFVAARHLKAAGWPVRVALLGSPQALVGDAAHHARLWSGQVEPLTPAVLHDAGLVVDALFGAGLSRPLDGIALQVVQALNAGPWPVCAIDVPSGLDGANGQPLGETVQADFTVTFFRKKPGHVLMPGRLLCGELVLSDIGIASSVLDTLGVQCLENDPVNWLHAFPWPRLQGHKYHRGHTLVVGGELLTGASRLSALACARVGSGLVTLAAPQLAWPVYASALTSIMVQPFGQPEDLVSLLAQAHRNAVVIGPGLGVGSTVPAYVQAVLQARLPTVLDADALSVFQLDPACLFENLHASCVLTPHEGEFARLFPGLSGSRLERARQAAQLSGAVVVLKGPDTVIAAPDGWLSINTNAPPDLATGGSGDVLAGFIAGLMAQGMPAFQAACAGVWLQGECARAFGPGLIADDLPGMLPGVLKSLR